MLRYQFMKFAQSVTAACGAATVTMAAMALTMTAAAAAAWPKNGKTGANEWNLHIFACENWFSPWIFNTVKDYCRKYPKPYTSNDDDEVNEVSNARFRVYLLDEWLEAQRDHGKRRWLGSEMCEITECSVCVCVCVDMSENRYLKRHKGVHQTVCTLHSAVQLFPYILCASRGYFFFFLLSFTRSLYFFIFIFVAWARTHLLTNVCIRFNSRRFSLR